MKTAAAQTNRPLNSCLSSFLLVELQLDTVRQKERERDVQFDQSLLERQKNNKQPSSQMRHLTTTRRNNCYD